MKQYRSWAQVGALIFLTCFLLSLRPYLPVQATVEDPLVHALEATGATVQEITVNGWSKLPLHELSDDEMAGIIRQAVEKLGFKSDQYEISYNRSANHRQVKAEARNEHSYVVVVVQVLYPSWEKKGHEVYMIVNIDKVRPGRSGELQASITKLIYDNGGSARVNTCLVGWLDGKLEKDEKVSKLNSAFKAVDASIISSLSYPNLASYTGFTPLVSESLMIEQERVNINVAIRYSQYDNRTYVMVGSPVITREY